MRHQVFIYPLLALLASVAVVFLFREVQNLTLLIGLSIIPVGLLVHVSLRLQSSYRQLDQAESHLNSMKREMQTRLQELKQSQAQLVQSEKMSSLGQMVAGVTHEINTPLAYTRSNTVLVESQLSQLSELVDACARQADYLLADEAVDEDQLAEQISQVSALAQVMRRDYILEEMRELLQNNVSGLDQIAELVRNLKNFSRPDRQKIASVNLNEGLDSVLIIARNELKYKVDVVKEYGEIPPICCAPSQINQVFLNLIVNAAHAIEQQGTLTLRTRAQGDNVVVEIEDDGKGIAADVLPVMFDPFFTTKEVGQGTGLGLSIAYQIIDQHGGRIAVDSEPGKGTRFTIYLPRDAALLPETSAVEVA